MSSEDVRRYRCEQCGKVVEIELESKIGACPNAAHPFGWLVGITIGLAGYSGVLQYERISELCSWPCLIDYVRDRHMVQAQPEAPTP